MKLNSLEETHKLLEERSKDIEYTFAIVLKENNKVIGEIYAYTEDYNISSQNLCKKLGMRKEGFLKNLYHLLMMKLVIQYMKILCNELS